MQLVDTHPLFQRSSGSLVPRLTYVTIRPGNGTPLIVRGGSRNLGRGGGGGGGGAQLEVPHRGGCGRDAARSAIIGSSRSRSRTNSDLSAWIQDGPDRYPVAINGTK